MSKEDVADLRTVSEPLAARFSRGQVGACACRPAAARPLALLDKVGRSCDGCHHRRELSWTGTKASDAAEKPS